jgi:hypothetical protein
VLEWIIENYEWVLSDIGTLLLLSIIWWLKYKYAEARDGRIQAVRHVSPPKSAAQRTLVASCFWSNFVNCSPEPSTRHELLILMLFRYPRWTSRGRLRRSLKCLTHPLDDAIADLMQGRQVVSCCRIFFRLSRLGLQEAQETTRRYEGAHV